MDGAGKKLFRHARRGDLGARSGREARGAGRDATLVPVSGQRVNVLARLPTLGGGSSVMLNRHIDTSMAGEGWAKAPFGGGMGTTPSSTPPMPAIYRPPAG